MEIESARNAELRVKHLEMIQAVVTRMAAQAASVKNYCITLTTTVCGFAITLHRPNFAYLALLPIAAFAYLDACFLWVERGYRDRFDQTRLEPSASRPSFDLRLGENNEISFIRTLKSWSIFYFYAPLAFGVVTVTLIAELIDGRF